MFHYARIKLTAWYLLIVMLISISFSLVIYRALSQELGRWAHVQRVRLEYRLPFLNFSPSENVLRVINPQAIEQELLDETKQRLITILILINMGILLMAGGSGYFLAGRTLAPIKDMVEEQNRFVSDASHELRTPLTALKSNLEVHLRDSKMSIPQARELISGSITDVNKLQNLTDALLQLAQYQKPNGQFKLEKLALIPVIAEVVKRVMPLAKEKKILIKTKIPDIDINANRYGLLDLLVIILDNAVKYSPRESVIAITSSIVEKSVKISIIDNGIGIKASDIPHIFDRFYRADNARTQFGKGGYGLGLSIANKIVEAHHGSITVKSIPHKETVFTFKLPLR